MPNLIYHLTKNDREDLFDSLNYMKVSEIKNFCHSHSIPISGKKGALIERIKQFLNTGKISQPTLLPGISKAKKEKKYPLNPNTLILHGSYRNDLKTRTFFQKIIGPHFHFTAFGQDWIASRWQKGNPPTYGQFAKAWQNEFLHRKTIEANPKKEWAYLNFMKRFLKEHPQSTRNDIAKAWEKTRSEKVRKAKNILDEINSLKNR